MSRQVISVKKAAQQTQAVSKALSVLLADSYTTYLLTHNYHWNVEGQNFYALHKLFEEQYTELFAANDEIAERIRALGAYAFAGGYHEMLKESAIKNLPTPPIGKDGAKAATVMIQNLIKANEACIKSATATKKAAEKDGDDETVDLAVGRVTVHQKTNWMLSSLLK